MFVEEQLRGEIMHLTSQCKSLVLLAITTTFVLSCAASADASILAYWRFEEGTSNTIASGAGSIADSAGSFTGTPTGNPTYRSAVGSNPVPSNGFANTLSLEFDGAGDFVLIPDPTGILNPTTAFTVEFWMRAGVQVAALETLVDHSHGFVDQTGWAFQTQPSGVMRFAVGDGGPFHEAISFGTDVRDDAWHHIAGVFDSTNDGQELSLYIDGILSGTDDNGGASALGNNREVEFGRASGAGMPRYYDGFLDEIRISDEALIPSQFLFSSAVPEPSSFVLMGMLSVCFVLGYRKSQSKNQTLGTSEAVSFSQPGNQ